MVAAPEDSVLRNELGMLWQAIAATRSAIIVTDHQQPDDPIVYCNPAFEQLTGYDQETVMGSNCRFLQGPETDPVAIARIRAAIASGTGIQVEIRNYRRDGTPFWNDLVISPVQDASGHVTHFIGLQLDVTERRETIDALKHSQEALARSNRELEQFAYVVSHDLQEPLRMVVSYLELLERRYGAQLAEDGREFLQYAMDGGKRMQALIRDLLLFSRVQTRAHPFEATDLNRVLVDVLANLEQTIRETDAKIESASLPTVDADPVQMVQILQNLIGNAIKFARPGTTPLVRIAAQRDEQEWQISVADNGIGIDPEYHERIFRIFHRLHTREEFPGTGIGLAICQRIAERHGGRIWVESNPGTGTIFSFSIRDALASANSPVGKASTE